MEERAHLWVLLFACNYTLITGIVRHKNKLRTERAQLSLSENTDRILREVADIGILGKTKTEVAARIVTDWIWSNEDRLSRQGISISGRGLRKAQRKKDAA